MIIDDKRKILSIPYIDVLFGQCFIYKTKICFHTPLGTVDLEDGRMVRIDPMEPVWIVDAKVVIE